MVTYLLLFSTRRPNVRNDAAVYVYACIPRERLVYLVNSHHSNVFVLD